MDPKPSSRVARFGTFEADLASGDLRKSGQRVTLRGRPFEILEILLTRAGEVVTREELRQALWTADTFVDFDHGLNTAVNRLREALGDTATNPRFVETLPRRGYRFLAPVQWGDRPEVRPTHSERSEHREPVSPPESPEPAPPRSQPSPSPVRASRVLLAVAALAILAGLTGLWWHVRSDARNGPVRIAVLPFLNLAGDGGQEYFVDGITDALIAELAQLDRLRVISRTSVMPYKGTRLSLPAIAAELHVDTIVEGSVLSSGDRVRVTAQLIEAATDRHLWANTYERASADVLVLQREVVRDIAREVRATLSPREEARLAARPSVDPLAYEAYLRGRILWDTMSKKGLEGSIGLFERSIALDPGYAPAYAGLADAYWILGSAGFEVAPQLETVPKARAAARKAMELDPDLDRAEATLGFLEIDYDWNFAAGERRVRAVLERNPSLASVHTSFSYYLAAMGRFEEAIAAAKRGQELDPLSVVPVQTLGFRYYYARRYAEAAMTFGRALDRDPGAFVARVGLGLVRFKQGRTKEALQELERSAQDSGDNRWVRASLAYVSARSGQLVRARQILARFEEESRGRYVPAFYPAVVQAGLGDSAAALAFLEKAFAERSGWMVFLKVEPFFDSLRADPRFVDLLGRVGLPGSSRRR
jgi:TolB-like protein/DNA-binding winged helix-turn-helix (wHTH) protein/Tfp pilus assembly protein PilF